MGKRKRTEESDIVKRVLKKVKRLVKPRRRIVSSSSSSSLSESSSKRDKDKTIPPEYPHHDLEVQASDLEIQDEIPNETPSEEVLENDELDPDILQLLGSDPTQTKSFGDNLHKDLATRWKHILTNGLTKDEKVDLMKQYLPAENCTYMKAPTLNPEIRSALSDINAKRDSYSEQKQNQMASCISAIGKALNLALTQTDNIPQDIIKTLSDAGRLLCDTHYRESLSRRFAIVNSISKQKREIIKITKIDEHLFGSNLSEHLKSSKAISTSASELRFNTIRPARIQPTTSTRNPGALNARGAPRATAAEPRVFPSQYRRPPPPPPAHEHPPASRDYRRAPPPPAPAPRSRARPFPQQNRRY